LVKSSREVDPTCKFSSGAITGAAGSHYERAHAEPNVVEMDAFDSSKGVVILAATDRPEVLDGALLRAARFDRQMIMRYGMRDRLGNQVFGRPARWSLVESSMPFGENCNLRDRTAE
jgi:hypothetical protein